MHICSPMHELARFRDNIATRSTTVVNLSRLVFRVSGATTIHLEATARARDKVVFVTKTNSAYSCFVRPSSLIIVDIYMN